MAIRKPFLVALFLVLTLALNARSQWVTQSQDTVIRSYNKVFMLDGRTGWIGGSYGSILKTTDGGKTWVTQYSTQLWSDGIGAITFVDSLTGFAVGFGGTLMRTTNGGATWSLDSTTFKTIRDSSYSPLTLSAAKSGNSSTVCLSFIGLYSGGIRSLTYCSHDHGASWNLVNIPEIFVNQIPSLAFSTPSTVLAMGQKIDSVYRSTDGGQSWQSKPLFEPANFILVTFRFLNPDTGYFAGSTNGSNPWSTPSTIGWTYDGGLTWQVDTNAALYNDITGAIWFLSRQRGVAITTKIGSFFETSDGGTTWNEFKPANSYPLADVGSADGRTVVVVGAGGEILVSSDSAVTWNDLTPPKKLLLTQVHFLSNGMVTAVGDYDGLFISADSGKTWTRHQMPSGLNDVIAFGDTLNCWIADDSSRIYHSSDFGSTWSFQDEQYTPAPPLFGIDFLNDEIGCAVGGSGYIMWTNNGGAGWNPETIPSFPDSLFSAFVASPTKTWTVGSKGAIFCSSDGFKTWVQQPSPVHTALRYVFFSDTLNGYVLGDGGTILKTTDGGGTWTVAQSPSPGLNAMKFVDSDTGWVVGSGGKIFNTVDGGSNWTAQSSGVSANLLSVDFVNSDNGIIVADDGSVLTTIDGGNLTAVNPDKPSVPTAFELSQNYPNPFNPSTVISYQLPVNSFVTLRVYDVLGREVATLVNAREQAGTYNVRFDGANLPSGVYFYQLDARSFAKTMKMLLLK